LGESLRRDGDSAPTPKFIGDLVSTRRQGGHESDADHIRRLVEVQRLDVLIDDPHLVLRRSEGGDGRQRQERKTQQLAPGHSGMIGGDTQMLGRGKD